MNKLQRHLGGLYRYRAVVPSDTSVYDGDTFRADIDLGMNTWIRDVKIRIS